MKTFDELSIDEKLALHRAFYEGREIEWSHSPMKMAQSGFPDRYLW